MSETSWIDLINGLTDAYQWSAMTLEELKAGQIKYGLVQKYEGSADDSQAFFYTPVYKSVGIASSGGANTSAKTSSVLANCRIRGTNASGKIITQAFVGRALNASKSDMVKTGVIMVPQYQLVASIAQTCGRSIGWEIAKSIVEWLNDDKKDGGAFDWGPSSITGSNVIACIGKPHSGHVIYHVEYRLFTRLLTQLRIWGLWEIDPGAYVPYEPVMDEVVTYDFRGRFPNIPEKYVERVEYLINELINKYEAPPLQPQRPHITPLTNWYIVVSINRNENMLVTIWDVARQEWHYRSEKMNGAGTFQYNEEDPEILFTLDPAEFMYGYPNRIFSSGNMGILPRREVYLSTDFIWGNTDNKQPGVCYDNFGTYRPIYEEDGLIRLGPPTDDLSQVFIDENAVDLITTPIDQPNTQEHPNPNYLVWDNRIYVSTPDFDQPNRQYPSASDLNLDEAYIQFKLVGRAIDPNGTQDNGFWGYSDTDLTGDLIDKTPNYTPNIGTEPSPVPPKPPSELPNPPVLPDGVNSIGLMHLYGVTGGVGGQMEAFHDWLWAVDPSLFSKMYSDPMQALIGCHAIFTAPESLGTHEIIMGNLIAANCNASIIKQFKKLECGSMYIQPYFKNINDIISTQIQLYLPFIGFVDISPKDVIYMDDNSGAIHGRYLFVDYYIDFLTGACIASISTKESLGDSNNFIYNYAGNCSVEIPLTSANYSGVIRNVISAAADIYTGNTMGVIDKLTQGPQIERSGSCGSNAGAMGPRRPYLIITRTKSFDADNRRHFEGLPQNRNVKLGAMQGYTRVKFINLDGIYCTEEEKEDILQKLQNGVFL